MQTTLVTEKPKVLSSTCALPIDYGDIVYTGNLCKKYPNYKICTVVGYTLHHAFDASSLEIRTFDLRKYIFKVQSKIICNRTLRNEMRKA